MFTRTVDGVASTDGFDLRYVDPQCYHYLEGEKVMKVHVDPCTDFTNGDYLEVSAGSLLQWQAPHESVELSNEQRERIRTNLSAALSFMGHRVTFDDELPSEDSLLSEIPFYVEYGLHDRALALLKRFLTQMPGNTRVREKLNELQAALQQQVPADGAAPRRRG